MESAPYLDGQLLKVPYETLKRQARERKGIIERLQSDLATINNAAADESLGASDAQKLLSSVASRLRTEIEQGEKGGSVERNKLRLPYLLVDHLLREGHFMTAHALTQEYNCRDLCDWHIFGAAEAVVASLRARCSEHAVRLKRIKSRLRFHLLLQEYVELVKRGQVRCALQFARDRLSPFADDGCFDELKSAIALLMFGQGTACPRYTALLSEERWATLVDLFVTDLLAVHGLTPVSLLELQLQAGLTALKSPLSFEDGCTKEDPLYNQQMKKLAEGLPAIKNQKSRLVCAITHTIMDDSNPPMVLPNGYVYSKRALTDMAAVTGGRVTCPLTGSKCFLMSCRQAYVL